MKLSRSLIGSFLMTGVVALSACGDDGGSSGNDAAEVEAVNSQYAANVFASYNDSVTTATALQAAVDAFVANPTAPNLEAAKTAWKASREPYLLTEVYRFYNGPIDNEEDGPEGAINAWPIDENFIDYVDGMSTSGIINDTAGFPTITKDVIRDQNENGGEANISSGYHAVEFLLWGQDLDADGPGARAFTDYTTLANAERRKTYLKLATELLVEDLTTVRDAWADGATYRAEFEAGGEASLQKILVGMGSLSGAELSGERMTVAMENRDQEDEHSCFSDNTHRDVIGNGTGILNVYLGKYGTTDGKGIEDLVRAKDAALADKMKTQATDSVAKLTAIPQPFDQAIDDDAKRPMVQTAIDALRLQTDTTVEVAEALGVTLNLE